MLWHYYLRNTNSGVWSKNLHSVCRRRVDSNQWKCQWLHQKPIDSAKIIIICEVFCLQHKNPRSCSGKNILFKRLYLMTQTLKSNSSCQYDLWLFTNSTIYINVLILKGVTVLMKPVNYSDMIQHRIEQ